MTYPAAIHLNPSAASWRYSRASSSSPQSQPVSPPPSASPAQALHRLLPDYAPTPLRPLPSLAAALGLGHVLVKDESRRFGLPSFKILGASWAVHRAVARRLGVDHAEVLAGLAGGGGAAAAGLASLGETARRKGVAVRLATCTAGNWGRAVARMARYLGFEAVVFVPGQMVEATRALIRGEGAEVRVVEGDYDDALEAVRTAAEREGWLLVLDIEWEGFEEVPGWVVEGYQSMLDESDAQVRDVTGGQPATHAIVPVGCGSIAQAVTQHYKGESRERGGVPAAAVLAVEPETAACLKTSLEAGKMTTVNTGNTIMAGMNCGTLSTGAWPVLSSGVDGAVVVTDAESHRAVKELEEFGVKAGPCGAATLAALKRICVDGKKEELGLNKSSVVVLYCTEGSRDYDVPV